MVFKTLKELVEYLSSFDEFQEFKFKTTRRILFAGIPIETAERFGVTKPNLEQLQKSNPMNLALGWKYQGSPRDTFSIFNLLDNEDIKV